MEILIVIPKYNITSQKNYDYYFPLGLAYISSTLKKAKYSVNCINLNHFDGKISSILNQELNRKKYDVVCTGGTAIFYHAIKLVIDTASQHNSKPITILGGPILTSEPILMMNSIKPTYGVLGEGEVTILELLDALSKKKDLSKVDGIIYRDKKDKLMITKPREPIKNIESIPWPDRDDFGYSEQLDHVFCNTIYQNNAQDYSRPYSILASRGCPNNCSFCWHDLKYRARSIKDVLKEIEAHVKKYKINNIHILDECFSLYPQRVFDFCKGIKKISKKAGWQISWSCALMVTSVNEELLATMKDAGCFAICYGFESYSPAVLKSMKKPITPLQINRALNITMKAKINVSANFILGDIAETPETARETINFLKDHCKGQIGLTFVQPYPNSELYKCCIKKGIIKDKLYYIKNQMGPFNVTKITEHFTDKEFEALKRESLDVFGKTCKFVKPLAMKGMEPSPNRYEVTVKCPFCKNILTYKNCLAPNKWSFGFLLVCRNCRMRFFTVSALQKFAYRNYSKVRALRNYYIRLKSTIKRNLF